MHTSSSTLIAGLVSGFLFFAHALIPNSHAWPMVWPLLGGVVAVLLPAKRRRLRNFWTGIRKSAKAGILAGLIFLVFTLLALYLLSQPQFSSLLSLGDSPSPKVTASVALSLAAVAGIGVLLAIIAGAFAFPVVRRLQS